MPAQQTTAQLKSENGCRLRRYTYNKFKITIVMRSVRSPNGGFFSYSACPTLPYHTGDKTYHYCWFEQSLLDFRRVIILHRYESDLEMMITSAGLCLRRWRSQMELPCSCVEIALSFRTVSFHEQTSPPVTYVQSSRCIKFMETERIPRYLYCLYSS